MQDTANPTPATPVLAPLKQAAMRADVLGELHARPFVPLSTPRKVYHFAFLTDEAEGRADRETVVEMARAHGLAPPAEDAKYHQLELPDGHLRWEQHAEFTSYTWDVAAARGDPFQDPEATDLPRALVARQPGDLLVAVQLRLVGSRKKAFAPGDFFHPASLCVVETDGAAARVAMDFKLDSQGFTRVLIENRRLGDLEAGVLVQRILELETYRTLALLGLPVARSAAPTVRRVESELAEVTREISQAGDVDTNRRLLERLTGLAAELEALSAETAYRFGASRAYFEIVNSRVRVIREQACGNHPTISAFFARRLGPAIGTCNAIDQRQEQLSRKLARTAELLRTRIQFELEGQNRGLLQSMDRRAKLQLRLQQTVEGLSVAAITYYVVGLIGYMAKGAKALGLSVSPPLVAAASVPFVAVGVWWIVHRVRKSFMRPDTDGQVS